MSASADWKQRPEGGGRGPIRLIAWLGRHLGRGAVRWMLVPITAYFLCVRGAERRASRDYLRRALGRRASLWQVARHIHTFASTILDRVFLLGGRIDDYRIDSSGTAHLLDVLAQGRGALLFGAHLGSFDALRAFGRQCPDIRIKVVLDISHNRSIAELMNELAPELAGCIIDAGQDGATIALAMQQALEEGALVCMLADRLGPGEAGVPARLFGDPVRMPAAPWLLASALQAPVLLGFGLYRGGNHYAMVFEPFAERIHIPRRERAQQLPLLIDRYLARLEHHLGQLPYNWFNFYDFWNAPVADPARPGRPAVAGDGAGQRP